MLLVLSFLLFGTTCAHNHVTLTQNSFSEGPVICDTDDTTYTFAEDVVFDPSSEDLADSPEFALGFFAALIIQANNVEINLNDHVFAASERFTQTQRFFSLIELGSSPFIAKAGPFEFPNQETGFIRAENVHIHGGTFGRSSHSSIHGNNAEGVLVEDVTMEDFEVSGFHCNGCNGVVLQRVVVGPSLAQVPHNPRLSQAQQAVRYCKRLEHYQPQSLAVSVPVAPASKTLGELCEDLEQEVAYALDNPDSTAAEEFANDDTIPDGSAVYGIAVVGRRDHGPIVGNFHKSQPFNDNDEIELVEWVMTDEGESCVEKCSLGCDDDDFISGSYSKVQETYRHIFEDVLEEDCETVSPSSSSITYPYINEESNCHYKLSGGTCMGSRSDLRRLCPCKTGLAKYERNAEVVNPYDESVREKKCGPGFVAIQDQNACKLAAEELDAELMPTGPLTSTYTLLGNGGKMCGMNGGHWTNEKSADPSVCMNAVLSDESCSNEFFSHSTTDGNCWCVPVGTDCTTHVTNQNRRNTYSITHSGQCWLQKHSVGPNEVRFTDEPESSETPVCVRPLTEFAAVANEQYETPTVHLYKVTVKDLNLNSHELPAVKANGNIIRGPFAGLLDHKWVTKDGNFGMWKYNTLAAAKFGLCRVNLGEVPQFWHQKVCSADLWEPLENFLLGEESLASAMGSVDEVGCGVDGMAHVNKGAVGLRIEDVPYAKLERVSIRNFESIGSRPASSPCNHLTDEHMRGSDVYGMVMGGVDKLYAKRVVIQNLESTDGVASGIAFNGRIPNWDLAHDLKVKNVHGAVEPSLVSEMSDLSCPFSGEKPTQVRWLNMNDGAAHCPARNLDMCEVGSTITGESC